MENNFFILLSSKEEWNAQEIDTQEGRIQYAR